MPNTPVRLLNHIRGLCAFSKLILEITISHGVKNVVGTGSDTDRVIGVLGCLVHSGCLSILGCLGSLKKSCFGKSNGGEEYDGSETNHGWIMYVYFCSD